MAVEARALGEGGLIRIDAFGGAGERQPEGVDDGPSVGVTPLNVAQISDNRIDPRLDLVRRQAIRLGAEGISPDWHVPIAMGAYFAAVDDAEDALAREDALFLCE